MYFSRLFISYLSSATIAFAFSPAQQETAISYTSALGMSSSVSESQPKHVVIAGSGMMATATAYYLAKEFGIASTLIDPSGEIAPAASGKAGGFLARDWNDGSPVGPLARRSFDLHQTIADSLGAESIQYRRLTCAAISVAGQDLIKPGGKKLDGIEWAQAAGIVGVRPLGDEDTIAQVHPKMLCKALFEATKLLAPQSKILKGKVVSAVYNDDSSSSDKEQLLGARLGDDSIVNGDALVYACGPWTADVMTGVKYHSVVVPTSTVLSQCVFFSGCGDPEVYVRPDSTAYCTGFPDNPVRVTEEPGKEQVRPDAVQRIKAAVQQASDLGEEASLLEQACYLPSTPDGLPIMGEVESHRKCYVVAGHSCWGILMGPASGESMAHIVATGESPHLNLDIFSPSRFGDMQLVP
jgi:glycine/D-amino acid oxidase-like deaminating enzyme